MTVILKGKRESTLKNTAVDLFRRSISVLLAMSTVLSLTTPFAAAAADDDSGLESCICEALCTQTEWNEECAICAADLTGCKGAAADSETTLMPPDEPAADDSNLEECICEALCSETETNGDCPICAADLTVCKGTAPDPVEQEEDQDIELTSTDNDAWEWDVYYTNEPDRYHAEETQKFSVKYQVNFSNSEDLEPYAVTIRIPAALVDKDGNIAREKDDYILEPAQYGIPTKEDALAGSVTANTSFYWEIVEENGVRYVQFTNFRKLTAGSNNNWEVGYKSGSTMDLRDESTWSLTPTITVERKNGSTDTDELRPLTGHVNTAVKLTNVTKNPRLIAGKNYAPGLYTRNQVSGFAGTDWHEGFYDVEPLEDKTVEEYQKYLLDKYYFVVWQVTADVTATQPYNLNMIENVLHSYNGKEIQGRVVFVKVDSLSTSNHDVITGKDGWQVLTECKKEYYDGVFTVVTAYPKLELAELGTDWDKKVYNEVKFVAEPIDGKDPDQESTAKSDWVYSDYAWTYRGVVDIDKADDVRHNAWTTEYDFKNHTVSTAGVGGIWFTTTAEISSYDKTHHTDSTDPKNFGEYIPGTSYTLVTVDETMYASPNPTYVQSDSKLLTKEDYYFNTVSVTRIDQGYDPWDDQVNSEKLEKKENTGEDYTTAIFAKFAKHEDGSDDNSDEWVLVKELVNEWTTSSDGRMYYSFTANDLKKEPYGVKVVQTTTNYSTSCALHVQMMIRGDSPVFSNHTDGYSVAMHNEDQFVTVRDESHISSFASNGSVIVREKTDYGDSWLYPVLREAQTKKVQKSAGTDQSTHTAFVRYNLSAYDGYFVDSASGIIKLRNMGITSPGKNSVVFFDLLPFGMSFDPSMQVIAGRVSSTSYTNEVGQERGWDTSNVTIKPEVVSSDYNGTGRQLLKFTLTYTGTDPAQLIKRTSSADAENMWAESWGVSFGAHYSWSNADVVKSALNLSAFMPTNNDEHIIGNYADADGNHGTIYFDDGKSKLPSYNGMPVTNLFTADLDGDGKTDEDIMFAFSTGSDELTTASESSIVKAVRADEDPYAPFGTEAVVTPGRNYTYDINVKTSNESLKHITIFDNMEIASYIRRLASSDGSAADESYYQFEDTFWHGTFAGINTTALEKLCSEKKCTDIFKIYYSADRTAQKPESGKPVADRQAMEELLSDNGWREASAFAAFYGTDWREQVGAIAVILPDDFTLEAMENVGFRVSMTAPPVDLSDDLDGMTEDQKKEVREKYVFGVVKDSGGYNTTSYGPANATAEYAYNNSAFYSEKHAKNSNDPIYQCVTGNTVRVSEKQASTFEIVKQLDPVQVEAGTIPDYYKTEEFLFTVFLEKPDPSVQSGTFLERYAYREYSLWRKNGDDWEQIETNKVHATNNAGQLTLKADQKAVFPVPSGYLYNNEETLTSRLKVVEEENIFWKNKQELTGIPGHYTLTATNTYQSVLYVTKDLLNAPKDMTEEQKKSYEFTFCLLDQNGDPVADWPYVMVDRVINGYTSPNILPMPADKPGKTDSDGIFKIHWGEVIAFGGLVLGENYTVEELPLPSDSDWATATDRGKVTVMTTAAGNSAKVENRYRWKDLYLTKSLTHTDTLDLEKNPVSFKFLLEQKNEDGKWVPLAGQQWVMTDQNHNVIPMSQWYAAPKQSGVTGEDGTFAVTMDQDTQYFKIMKLEGGQSYRISEVVDENGDAVNALGESTDFHAQTNPQTVTMPVFASGKEAAFKNDYLLRSIQVKKLVASSNSSDLKKVFTMKIELVGEDGSYSPYAGKTYKVYDEKGKPVAPTAANTLVTAGMPSFITNEEGEFYIMHNWTVSFDDVGRAGEVSYRVTEQPDKDGLKQLIPENGDPVEGTLTGTGGIASFVNGTEGMILMGKEFTPAKDNDEAQKLIDSLNDPSFVEQLSEDEKKDFLLTISFSQEISAQKVDPLGLNPTVEKIESVWELYPWERLIINSADLTADTTYSVNESKDDRSWHQFYEAEDSVLDGLFISVKAQTAVLDFQKGDEGLKMLVNELDVHKRSSVIRKQISPEHADLVKYPVPENALLTMRVERWNGSRWVSAEGIRYVVRNEAEEGSMAEPELISTATQTTGADGLLTVRRSKNDTLWPAVYFDDVVRIIYNTATPPAEGTLRIVEVPELSDSTWGRFISYTEETPEEGITESTFFNTNVPGELQLTKDVIGTVDPKVDFTFVLEQVMEYSGTLDEEDEEAFAILASVPGSGISYTIYDESGKVVGSGQTNANGELLLKGDQTAVFSLPEGTIWTVSELQNTLYKLDSIDESTGVYKLEDNKVVVEIETSGKEEILVEVTYAGWKPTPAQDFSDKKWFNLNYGFAPGDALMFSDLLMEGKFKSGTRAVTAADIVGMTVGGVEAEPVYRDGEIVDYMWVCPIVNTSSKLEYADVVITYLIDGEPKETELEIKLLPRYLIKSNASNYLQYLYVPECYADDAVKAAEEYSGAAVDAGALGYAVNDHLAKFDCNAEYSPLKVYPRVAKSLLASDTYFYFALNSEKEGRQLMVYARKDDPSVALIPETANIQYGVNYPGSEALGVYSFRGDDVTVTAAEGAVVYTNEQTLKNFNTYSDTQKVFADTVTDIWLPNEEIGIKPTNDSFLKGYASNTLIVHCNAATMKVMVGDSSGTSGTFKPVTGVRKVTYIDTSSSNDLLSAFKVYKGVTIQGFKTSASQNLYFVVYDEDPRTHSGVQLVTPKRADGTPDVSIYGLTN